MSARKATQQSPQQTQGKDSMQPGEQGFLSIAGSHGIVRRAVILALVIGSALTLINQPGAIFGGAPIKLVPLILVYLTPFVVIIVSQVLGARTLFMEVAGGRANGPTNEPFVATAAAHGIAVRALITALVVGTAVTPIIAGLTVLEGGDASRIPLAEVGQVYALPLFFGLISQTASYRRARGRALGDGQTQ